MFFNFNNDWYGLSIDGNISGYADLCISDNDIDGNKNN